MAGKTDRTQLQFLYKKALGFANTSNIFTENEETIPSTNQLSAQTIFGEDVPRAVTRTLNTVQSGTAEYVLLTASVLPGTTYDANDPGGGGDGAQSPGPHAYYFQMASDYEASTDNSKAGTFPFVDSQTIYETSGSLQLIGPGFSGNSPNPYLIKLYEDDGSGGVGNEISLTDEIDWLVDYYNGILFVQDYDSGKIPAFARAFIYTGNMLSASLSGSGGGGSGDVTNASNLGSGQGLFAQKTGTVLDFKGLAVSSGLTISSNSTTITLSTNFGSLARSKSNYEVTQSHKANNTLVMPGVDYSNAAYNSSLIDVFLNGQLLLSGTVAQVSAGSADYSVVASGSLKFGFNLEADDNISSSIINNAATGGSTLTLNETPSGTVNGVNDTFTLSTAPAPSTSLMLFVDGSLVTQGTDYTLSSATITFAGASIPSVGQVLLATYQQ